jgi:hypothetical protein
VPAPQELDDLTVLFSREVGLLSHVSDSDLIAGEGTFAQRAGVVA